MNSRKKENSPNVDKQLTLTPQMGLRKKNHMEIFKYMDENKKTTLQNL